MMWILALTAALGGEVVFDVKIPARVSIDGEVVAEVYREGRLRMPYPDGEHRMVITTSGRPHQYKLVVGDTPVVVVVGRSGTTVGLEEPGPVAGTGPVDVRFRTADRQRLLVQVGPHRIVVPPGQGLTLPLELGEHDITIRSQDGTQIFARGVLTVRPGSDLVVQLAEGRLPETAGQGVAFVPAGS